MGKSLQGGRLVSNSRIFVDSGGNIGIGSTQPTSKFDITGGLSITGVTTVTGNIVVSGTVDGRDVATDGTKLDGIEANADVTDATNVAAAGAVMESDTSTASMSFVVDEDDMSSDSATKVPTQQSVKAYVDANAGAGSSDAATLDGLDSTQFLRSDADDTASGNITFTGNVTIEDSELKVGDVSADNYVLIKQVLSDDYGFDWQHNNASVFVNEQGTTNQALVLGDVDANNTYSGLFGISHTTDGGSNWAKKLDLRGNGELYIGSSAQNRVLTTADEGSGNGLDADTVDAIQASSFLRSDANDTATGQITLERNDASSTDFSLWIKNLATSSRAQIRFSNSITTQNGYFYYRHEDGSSNSAANSFHFDSDQTGVAVIIDDTGTNAGYYVGTDKVWHAGNDGSGSGLDADLLDGIQGSNFLRSDTNDSMSASNGPVLSITKSGSAPGNNNTLLVTNTYGNHSWGITGEFRVENNSGSDRPSILFSSGYNSDTWSLGFGYTDSNFRIKTDHGHRNSGWGSERMNMDRSGNATFSGNVTAYSDIRLKDKVVPLKNCLEKLKTLSGISFIWKDKSEFIGNVGKTDFGIIAQEVEKVFPEVVHSSSNTSDDGDNYKTVAYAKLIPVLIEAIKEQQSQINILKDEIKILKQESN